MRRRTAGVRNGKKSSGQVIGFLLACSIVRLREAGVIG